MSFKDYLKEIEEEKDIGLKEEMINYLKDKFKGLVDVNSDDFNFDAEAAIYWLANDYHGGQASELYSILSTSDFNPGPMHKSVEDEGEQAKMFYDELKDKFSANM